MTTEKMLDKQARDRKKAERMALKERKEKTKKPQDFATDAQKVFNKFIRLRDANDPCISCGNLNANQYHAGHYKTTKARPDLRFNEDNVNKQCGQCNFFESGNIHKYKLGLIEKIGQKRVDDLEIVRDNESSIEYYKLIKEQYKLKIKEIENDIK